MLNNSQMEPIRPILKTYPSDLKFSSKYQELDHPFLKAIKEDRKFAYTSIYGNQLIIYQSLRSNRQCIVIPQQ